MGKGGIPDRWLPYSTMSSVVQGTCFIACKVPLKEALLRNLPESKRFGPKDLMASFPKLGLLIDLTNTTRYYMKEEFTSCGIKYEKIFCPGRVIPSNSIVRQFNMVVDQFLDKRKDSNLLIAVHCTHGVNRTGYFICRYMIEKMNISPEDAMKWFQQARGHNIERQPYIDDLKNGCKGGIELKFPFKTLSHHEEHHSGDIERNHQQSYNNKTKKQAKNLKGNDFGYNQGARKYSGKNPSNNYNETHIENGDFTSANYRKNNYCNELYQRPGVFRLDKFSNHMKRPWHMNSQSHYNGPRPLNSQQIHNGSWPTIYHTHFDRKTPLNCYGMLDSLDSQLKPDYLKSGNSQPSIFVTKPFDYSNESKSLNPVAGDNGPIALDKWRHFERNTKLNSREYNEGSSNHNWRSIDSRKRTRNPNLHKPPDNPFHNQSPPMNSFPVTRPRKHHPGFQRPTKDFKQPPLQQQSYQSHNRVWRRTSQPFSEQTQQPQNPPTPMAS